MTDSIPTVSVTASDYLYFVDRAVNGMLRIVEELGDENSCARALPNANTPYGLLTHCLGVVEYWGGYLVGGRDVERDREAEFTATGTVADIKARVTAVLGRLEDDLGLVESHQPLRREPETWSQGPDRSLNQGAALLHLYEELAQHYGQMETLRDVLTARPVTALDTAGAEPAPFAPGETWLRNKRGVKWARPSADLLPAWVADMDFPLAPAIRTSIQDTMGRGDLGYPDWSAHPLAEAFSSRMFQRYAWQPDPDRVRGVTDLIQALQIVIDLASEEGDAVIAHTPNYPPFLATIASMNRQLITAPLVRTQESWTWDQQSLEAKVKGSRARILLLVNPQNPTGRVFRRSELELIADLAERHDLIVVSDEIHAELTFPGHLHIPFASLSTETAARTVTVTSATKAFNIAGLRTAVAHIGPEALLRTWDQQPPDLYGATNVLGVNATLAAWEHGDAWLRELQQHLLLARDEATRRLGQIQQIGYLPPEATYLAWLDFSALNLPNNPADYLRARARLELSAGADFGSGLESFARLNFATGPDMLDRILDRLAHSIGAGPAIDRGQRACQPTPGPRTN